MTDQHVAAVTLAGWGFELIPVSRKKIPCIKRQEGIRGGHHLATSNIAQIDQWWGHDYPHANIGCRPFPGHVVIDVDPRDGGLESFRNLSRGHFLPDTLITLTGSKGYHYWFKMPYDKPTKHVGAAPGIDIKTHSNGWVTMPGSIHKNGKEYTCLRFTTPAMLPPYLYDLVYKPEPKKPAPRPPRRKGRRGTRGLEGYLVDKVAGAGEGSRHNSFMEATFSAWRQCPHIVDDLVAAARSTGLDEQEIQNTLRSTYEATRAEGRLV